MATVPSDSLGFRTVEGELWVDQAPCCDLATRFGTPLMVYSRARLIANAEAVQAAFGGTPEQPRVFFPVQACYLGVVLQTLAACGLGAAVQSELELFLAVRAGFPPARILFHGPGTTDRELILALDHGLCAIQVESAEEVLRLNELAGRRGRVAPVGIRVQLLPAGEALDLIRLARRQPRLRVAGLHLESAPGQTSAYPYLEALFQLRELWHEVQQRDDWTPEYLDLGDGFVTRSAQQAAGIELASLAATLVGAAGRFGAASPALWMEPGQLIVGDAGAVLTRALRAKRSSDQRWPRTDAATNLLLPGELQPREVQPVRPLPGQSTATGGHAGTLLAVPEAGAYTLHAGSSLGYPEAAVVWVDAAGPRLVRPRRPPAEVCETWF